MNSDNDQNNKYLSLFSNGEQFLYVFKKTEKIVQAIHLATSHFESNEPLKFELREKSLSFLSYAFALNSLNSYERTALVQSFISSSLEIISYIKIATISGYISKVNSQILNTEIESVSSFLKENILSNDPYQGLVLSKDFFNTGASVTSENPKGHSGKMTSTDTDPEIKKNEENRIFIKDKKNKRQQEILEMLKRQANLTVKDFTHVIQGCSEKTIQRELIELVEKGLVKREGERRWSRYSLK